jgi:hypothetical protein
LRILDALAQQNGHLSVSKSMLMDRRLLGILAAAHFDCEKHVRLRVTRIQPKRLSNIR